MGELSSGEVDLVLTDPPYCISKETGFSKLGKKGIERFAVSMDFGEWDKKVIDIKKLATESHRVLRIGGTIIVWYDIWKITLLADALKAAGFKQLRFLEWIKKNPVPLNSKTNYLTNAREIAIAAVKGGKSTFNSEYDNGIYSHPIANNGERFHPTQKPLELFAELVIKHSSEGDFIIDPFAGSGTTGVAAIGNNRRFAGCDIDFKYVEIANRRIEKL